MDWPAVRDCSVIGIRAGDSSGVASKPGGVPVAADVVVGAEVPLVAGALEAGALATGTMTATPARTAPKAARRARAVECNGGREDEPTRARYAGA